MEFNHYQDLARQTVQLNIKELNGRVELVLGLSSELGVIARVYRRFLRDNVSLEEQGPQLTEGLGDVLWYLAMIASSMDLPLEDVVAANLKRIRDRYRTISESEPGSQALDIDDCYPESERFPLRAVFELKEEEGSDYEVPHVSFKLVQVEPNLFPDGPSIGDNEKEVGYTLGKNIGDVVNDNSLREDGYRYHDAVHVAFMAVLGWSPVLRGLLRLKRKSDPVIDRTEDCARARDLEEALSAVIFEMGRQRNGYKKETDIDSDVRDVIRKVVANLEVGVVPIWVWANAIFQGYRAMHALRDNKGGFLLADRKRGVVQFYADMPSLTDIT